MLKKLFLLLILPFALEALTLVQEDGKLPQPLTQLMELCELPGCDSPNDANLLLQKNWFGAGKERWQLQDPFARKKAEALPLLKAIGCLETVEAPQKHYDYALVLGALSVRIERRLDFLYEEWKRGVRFKTLVFLTGQRDLEPTFESFPKGIESETQIMLYMFHHHPLSKALGNIPLVIIDTPKQMGKRPNTADTVVAWLASRPQSGNCLAISDQPFVGYQEAVIRPLLPAGFTLDVVGVADSGNLPLSIYLDNLAKWLFAEVS